MKDVIQEIENRIENTLKALEYHRDGALESLRPLDGTPEFEQRMAVAKRDARLRAAAFDEAITLVRSNLGTD